MEKLRVSNMVFTGRGPFKSRFSYDEFDKVTSHGRLRWDVPNEDSSPILQTRIPKHELTVDGKPKHACASFWTGGSVIITGVISRREAETYYKLAVPDVRRALSARRRSP